MSSWLPSFNQASEAFAKIGGELNELTTKVGGELNELTSKVGGELNELSTKVQGALPIDNELINKLTLRSDELVREHELLDAQEKRKELVREYLSEILPWETKDESQSVLVEKCREEIMKLSQEKSTFETPFLLERGIMFNPPETFEYYGEESEEEEVNFENEDDNDDDETEKDPRNEDQVNAANEADKTAELIEAKPGDSNANEEGVIDASIIAASTAKLEKMQPLPLLLEHFDIDTHVGLIERLLQVDENLVDMHSMLSGAGEKESTFWRNYFFHCAYTRYENGLSIEEIWSSKPKAIITGETNMTSSTSTEQMQRGAMTDPSLENIMDDESSVELELEIQNSIADDDNAQHTHAHSISVPTVNSDVEYSVSGPDDVVGPSTTHSPPTTTTTNVNSDSSGSGISYEMIGGEAVDVDVDVEDGDMEDLDDLEAEIARELGED